MRGGSGSTPRAASPGSIGRPPVVDLATWQAARDELLVREKAHTREGDAIAAARSRLWHDGAPHQGQFEGCTVSAWHLRDTVYLNARGVSFAVVTEGRWDEVSPYLEFMGYTQP